MRIIAWKIFKSGTMEEIVIKSASPQPLNEYFVIEAAKDIAIGDYEIEVKFSANVSTILTGFYKSTYKDKNGKTR